MLSHAPRTGKPAGGATECSPAGQCSRVAGARRGQRRRPPPPLLDDDDEDRELDPEDEDRELDDEDDELDRDDDDELPLLLPRELELLERDGEELLLLLERDGGE
jgi:hypothetical protein